MERVAVNTALPVGPNRKLYNAGSDWQKETGRYSTQYREYDPALGRFHAIDPMASSFATWTPYMYGYNDPVNANDPDGAQAVRSANDAINNLLASEHGGTWAASDPVGGVYKFQHNFEAMDAGFNYNNYFNSWKFTEGKSWEATVSAYEDMTGITMLKPMTVKSAREDYSTFHERISEGVRISSFSTSFWETMSNPYV
ncbi:MAG: RHS repeat-associated core domain-containing protein [Cyclobacteriaceae bacterium]